MTVTVSGSSVVFNDSTTQTTAFTGTATTATNLAGGSNGTIPYQTASGTTAMLAVGTSGQVLKTNGAGAPSWVTPSSGALTLLSSLTASSASTASVETGFSSTYDNYLIIVNDLNFSGSGAFQVLFKIAGSYITSSNYYYSTIYADTANAISHDYGHGVTSATILNSTGSSNGLSAMKFDVFNANSSTMKSFTHQGEIQSGNTGRPCAVIGSIGCDYSGVLTGVQFSTTAGTLSGKFYLYGYSKV
jgi:hypothetical protein